MKSGNVVEYIDRQKIFCAVVREVKKQRLSLLTENDREVNLSAGRLSHACSLEIDLAQGRDKAISELKKIAARRAALTGQIDIHELWEVLNTEQEWIDLKIMTEFCFPDSPTCDHQSAVIRAFFNNRLYFKFSQDRFFPHTPKEVKKIAARHREAQRRDHIISQGGQWLKSAAQSRETLSYDALTPEQRQFIDLLKSYYLFGNESPDHALTKALLKQAGMNDAQGLFPILVKLGVFGVDENVTLLRYQTPIDFAPGVMQAAQNLIRSPLEFHSEAVRKDFTKLPLLTIDGQSTQDFDDAISIEEQGDEYLVGVHIADVGHMIRRGDAIDAEALTRGSSIYMPDQRIPMLPACLAEGLCSLVAGKSRPAISTLIRIRKNGDIVGCEIVPSRISVRHQLSYFDVNLMAEENPTITTLWQIAKAFREKRLQDGAIQITLPEINVWVNENREVKVSKINRESPSRMLISELMILANWLTARFLSEHQIPAIFRSQPDPKSRLFKGEEGTLFQNYMQRKLLSRFVLSSSADRHSGLGVDAYLTATSPIRKYFDLVTQRQIRSVFGLETPYTTEEIDQIIQALGIPMGQVSRLQFRRNRYWLLKYLEGQIGAKLDALVLFKRRHAFQVLLSGYMLECSLPVSTGISLKPEDVVQVTLQHVNAHKDILSVFLG